MDFDHYLQKRLLASGPAYLNIVVGFLFWVARSAKIRTGPWENTDHRFIAREGVSTKWQDK
jgi:hypothetical protein